MHRLFYRFYKGLFLFALYYLTPLCAQPEMPVVSCALSGQLGNQLFQISTTLAYSWDFGALATFPDLHSPTARLSYNKEHLFFRLNNFESPLPLTHTFTESVWHSSKRISFQPCLYLQGCFQSWNHFHHHRDKLLQVFAPSSTNKAYIESKYEALLDHPFTVAVHVRTLNKQLHDDGYPFLGLDYYEKAMHLFPKEALFVVFSDRINWCKEHFKQFDRPMIFIEGNDHIQDLLLMSSMKHQIIGNSTYSWWGAYLNQNPDKRVLAPKYWLYPYSWPPQGPNFFYFPEWEVVDFVIQPFPDDMRDYDKRSESIDTQ